MKFQLNRRWMYLIALIVLVAGIAVWRARTTAVSPEQRYKTQSAERGDITQSVAANGTLNPVILVNVGTQVSGTVKKLHVDFNDRVQKGQVLLELDDTVLSSQAAQDEANLKNAKASLDLALANEKRNKSLFAQEYVSAQDLDTAVQGRKSAQSQVEQVQAQLRKDHANLDYSIIRSPVSGVVVDRQVDVGQTVAASFQTPTLFKIAQDLSRMQIDSSFAEADIGNIKVGQPVRFNVDAFPNRTFYGSVRQLRLNPTTTQSVVTYDVVVEVNNPDQVLLPGMTAYVNIVVAQSKDALLAPNAALRFKPVDLRSTSTGDQPKKKRDAATGTLYVLDGGKLKPVTVTLGITDNRVTEILGGELKAGDKIVVGENQAAVDAPSAPNAVHMRMF
jgi:HlyD family secretion protein